MVKRIIYLFTGIILSITSGFVFASSTSIGAVAEKLTFSAGIMSHVMWAACIVVGIILLSAAFSQYQIHRSNPKVVPLGIPITYLILALLALAIPFVGYLTGLKESKEVQSQKQIVPGYYTDID